ncbi:hypothetical protein BDZ91DRAFT_784461 [Kalaharituber pfeilii]|nr:hypothetical protein BDZ91DRAFT_784461 [Kalaharituber pfeilii]
MTMSQANSRATPYGDKQSCRAWFLFLKENWSAQAGDEVSPKQHRKALMRKWETADQDFRNIYVQRANEEDVDLEDLDDYHPDFVPSDFRAKLTSYPCIRVYFDDRDTNKWEKLQLFLKLDDALSPLDEEELPPIVEIRDGFHLEEYAKRFIMEDGNFRLMGRSNTGQPVFFYHIIMLVDEQSFQDGTLLHVDFNRSGDPALSFRYPAIHSYLPWSMHQHEHFDLRRIDQYITERGGLPQTMDLTKPVLSILKDEMELRGIMEEDSNFLQLAHAAVSTLNPRLLSN